VQGPYGAMFAAAVSSASVTASSLGAVIEAGRAVAPAGSRYAAAMRRGVELGGGDLDGEAAVDARHAEFGHLHGVHTINISTAAIPTEAVPG
jgi:hypothetical protein